MTFGAFGVGRIGGKAVMVPGAVVGDRLDVEIVSERRDYSVAKIREVVQRECRAAGGALSIFAAMWRVRLAAYRVCGAGAVQGRGRCARVGACAGNRDRSRRAGRGSAGRVWVSVEDTAQGRRQRRAWVLRGRQQHDCRDRFVHGCRGRYADAGASGAIARQARRGDRGGARRRARGAGRASEEAADGRGPQARAQRARSGRRDCGNRAARGHAAARRSATRQFRSSSRTGCQSRWTPICSAR